MGWAALLIIWTVIALLVAIAITRMFAINPRDDEPDPGQPQDDDRRIIELCRQAERARRAHKASARFYDEARRIRTERMRQQYGRRA